MQSQQKNKQIFLILKKSLNETSSISCDKKIVINCFEKGVENFSTLCQKITREIDSLSDSEDRTYNTGKWDFEEHLSFIFGVLKNGTDWKETQKLIKTRSCIQARSHGQKFFKKVCKNRDFELVEFCSTPKKLHNSLNELSTEQLINIIKFLIYVHLDFSDLDEERSLILETRALNFFVQTGKCNLYTQNITNYQPSQDNIIKFQCFCEQEKWADFSVPRLIKCNFIYC
jgi:hypothetical protein